MIRMKFGDLIKGSSFSRLDVTGFEPLLWPNLNHTVQFQQWLCFLASDPTKRDPAMISSNPCWSDIDLCLRCKQNWKSLYNTSLACIINWPLAKHGTTTFKVTASSFFFSLEPKMNKFSIFALGPMLIKKMLIVCSHWGWNKYHCDPLRVVNHRRQIRGQGSFTGFQFELEASNLIWWKTSRCQTVSWIYVQMDIFQTCLNKTVYHHLGHEPYWKWKMAQQGNFSVWYQGKGNNIISG